MSTTTITENGYDILSELIYVPLSNDPTYSNSNIIIQEPSNTSVYLNDDPTYSGNNIVIQDDPQLYISVSTPGLPGPPGPQGAKYTGNVVVQSNSSNVWIYNHNYGYYPAVQAFNGNMQEIEGNVQHTTVNQVMISFVIPVSGFIRVI